MSFYSNILVPVSFDDDRNTEGALAVAKALCADGGKITCLHVMELLPQYATEYLPTDYRDIARADLEASLKILTAGDDRVTPLIVDGHASRGILDFAKNNHADLIVIASHQPGMQDYLLGSTAGRVVRQAHCAVHVIRS